MNSTWIMSDEDCNSHDPTLLYNINKNNTVRVIFMFFFIVLTVAEMTYCDPNSKTFSDRKQNTQSGISKQKMHAAWDHGSCGFTRLSLLMEIYLMFLSDSLLDLFL